MHSARNLDSEPQLYLKNTMQHVSAVTKSSHQAVQTRVYDDQPYSAWQSARILRLKLSVLQSRKQSKKNCAIRNTYCSCIDRHCQQCDTTFVPIGHLPTDENLQFVKLLLENNRALCAKPFSKIHNFEIGKEGPNFMTCWRQSVVWKGLLQGTCFFAWEFRSSGLLRSE